MNKNQRKVLSCLVNARNDDCYYFLSFEAIAQRTRLDRQSIRRGCRSLAKKGFARFEIGLWDDEGPAGSGYGATPEGAKALQDLQEASL